VSLFFHLVFSTRNRTRSILDPWRDRLHAYLGGIVRSMGGMALEVGGTQDHVHILVSLAATHRIADVMMGVKSSSSQWVHRDIRSRRFAWQEGYGAFSVSRSDVEIVREYIRNQAEHHRRITFQEEYVNILREQGIEFDSRYLW
jgi:REP element-mobilizing transposase RayT